MSRPDRAERLPIERKAIINQSCRYHFLAFYSIFFVNPDIISPINSVPNSPKDVQPKSPSIATICLDEPTIVTDIATNRNNYIVKSIEVKAQSINSTSATSINEEDTCISLFATDECVPVLNSDDVTGEATYEPPLKNILQLKTMTECQKSRIILNVGGSRVETCVPTFQSDPSSNYPTWS